MRSRNEFNDIVDELIVWNKDLDGIVRDTTILKNHPISSREDLSEKQKDALKEGVRWKNVLNLVEDGVKGADNYEVSMTLYAARKMYNTYKTIFVIESIDPLPGKILNTLLQHNLYNSD